MKLDKLLLSGEKPANYLIVAVSRESHCYYCSRRNRGNPAKERKKKGLADFRVDQ